jgi:hypothetical protein
MWTPGNLCHWKGIELLHQDQTTLLATTSRVIMGLFLIIVSPKFNWHTEEVPVEAIEPELMQST